MIRCISLLAAATLAGISAPAMGQGVYDPGPPPLPEDFAAGTWEGEWQGSWETADTWRGVWHGTYTGLDGYPVEAEYRGTFIGDTRFVSDGGEVLYRDHDSGWREDRAEGWDEHAREGVRMPGPGMPPQSYGSRLGYSPDQRAAWLENCRAAYYDGEGRRRGEIIGGVLGAVAGGVAGNRIADGARLGGTLIGAGVGGLAGAAIGGAIGGERDRDRYDECEAYLLRYEQSYAAGHGAYAQGTGYGHGYGYGPVMWVKVPIVRKRRDCGCERVVEEWIEEEEVVAAPPRVKRVRIQQPAPVKTKTIRYTK